MWTLPLDGEDIKTEELRWFAETSLVSQIGGRHDCAWPRRGQSSASLVARSTPKRWKHSVWHRVSGPPHLNRPSQLSMAHIGPAAGTLANRGSYAPDAQRVGRVRPNGHDGAVECPGDLFVECAHHLHAAIPGDFHQQ